MRRTVPLTLCLLVAGSWLLFSAPEARAQNRDGSDPVIIVIDGIEYVLDDTTGLPPGFDQFDPFGPVPSDIVVFDDGQPLPAGFLDQVPPEYAFFVDPTLPVPDEFAFLIDPRLPVPPEYAFMFDERLPVPPEWAWLFPSVPAQAPAPVPVEPTPAAGPGEPVSEATPEPDPTPQVVVDLSPLADEPAFSTLLDSGESPTLDDSASVDGGSDAASLDAEKLESDDPVAPVAQDDPFAAVVAQAGGVQPSTERNATSNLLVPLLIFVAVASTALLAAIPVFLRQRSGTDTALRELALTDDLTRLANRRRLDRDLRMHNRSKKEIAAAMIDIDHFKRLNDDFSHAVGDLVLQHVAATISQNVRAADVAYRYGGEEFCVLLPGASENEAAAVVDRVRRAVEALSFEALDRNVTVSAGVASAKAGEMQGDHAMVRRADAALYAAKDAGRNRVMLSSLVEGRTE